MHDQYASLDSFASEGVMFVMPQFNDCNLLACVEDWEDEAVDLLLGVACAEAAELLAGARRLRRDSGTAPITQANVRLAADTRPGRSFDETEERAAKRRKEINDKPLPHVGSSAASAKDARVSLKNLPKLARAHGSRTGKSHTSRAPAGDGPSDDTPLEQLRKMPSQAAKGSKGQLCAQIVTLRGHNQRDAS
eukprot:s1269_g22.t1